MSIAPLRRAIVIFPECPELPRIEALRAAYDPLAARIPAHLTLVFPFESAIPTAALEDHLRATIERIAPFSITLCEVTGSEGEYLFLNVKRGNDSLIALHDRLYGGLLAPFRSPAHTYIPHVTIGHVTDPAAFQAALLEARMAAEALGSIEASVHAISSYRIEYDGPRDIEVTVAL